MRIMRDKLAAALRLVSVACSRKPLLEQSDCIVFTKQSMIAYNDEVLVAVPLSLGITGAVAAEHVNSVMAAWSDSELDISVDRADLLIVGKRKRIGITLEKEIRLPYRSALAPSDSRWVSLGKGCWTAIQRAAEVCGTDAAQPLTMVVCVRPNEVLACDNYRLLLHRGDTGFSREMLLPASSIASLSRFPARSVAVNKDGSWCYIRGKEGEVASIRCYGGKYRDVSMALKLEEGKSVVFPMVLRSALERAHALADAGYTSRAEVTVEEDRVRVAMRKEGMWFRETLPVSKSLPRIQFYVHPQLLADMLGESRRVVCCENRIGIKTEHTTLVISTGLPPTKKGKRNRGAKK